MKAYGLWIDGKWRVTKESSPVVDKAAGETVATISVAEEEHVFQAVEASEKALLTPIEPYQRYEIIMEASRILERDAQKIAADLCIEVGKPMKEALGEVGRARQTLILSAEEAKRMTGEMVPLAGAPNCGKRIAFTKRVPVGIVCAITPFNFPLNLACHKLGPALAAGNAVIYKPATATPLTAMWLCKVFEEAGLPAGYLNMLTGSGARLGEWLTQEPRIGFYSFTGSPAVGKTLLAKAGFRRVSLELGSNSANIVHEDAQVASVAELCMRHAFANAGQVCISCQRVYVHRNIFQEFCDAAVTFTKTLKVGNPKENETDIGPMIHEQEAQRAEAWVQEAVAEGALILTGGKRDKAWYEPTILTQVSQDMKVVCQETFAPIVSIIPYDTIAEAVKQVNDSLYGLQAGVFTQSIETANYCIEALHVGGVIINDGATFRTDNMPYGGVKESGIGREGPQYAVREMTEEKLVVFNM